jgi:hypothetical protein
MPPGLLADQGGDPQAIVVDQPDQQGLLGAAGDKQDIAVLQVPVDSDGLAQAPGQAHPGQPQSAKHRRPVELSHFRQIRVTT